MAYMECLALHGYCESAQMIIFLFLVLPPLVSLVSRGKKDQSLLVHGGLVVATFFLCLCFSLTSTLANTGNETVCKIAGTLLHYSLLSTLCWMTVEVFHTFLLVCCVFASSLPPCIFYLAGFGEIVKSEIVISKSPFKNS